MKKKSRKQKPNHGQLPESAEVKTFPGGEAIYDKGNLLYKRYGKGPFTAVYNGVDVTRYISFETPDEMFAAAQLSMTLEDCLGEAAVSLLRAAAEKSKPCLLCRRLG